MGIDNPRIYRFPGCVMVTSPSYMRCKRVIERFTVKKSHLIRGFLGQPGKPWFGNRSNPLEMFQLVLVSPESARAAADAGESSISNLISENPPPNRPKLSRPRRSPRGIQVRRWSLIAFGREFYSCRL